MSGRSSESSKTGLLPVPLNLAAGHVTARWHLRSPFFRFALLLLFLIGSAVRLYRFPDIPAGLHQDEISEAYEADSILHTGKDRWGHRLPAYFLSWGSGQNVMQAYLTIPVVAVTGLTRASTRIVPLVCGILTLPAFYFAVALWYGDLAALIALAALAFSPWHIFISRFGIENNPLPFFLALGLVTWTLALRGGSKWLVAFCLLPFIAATYTYGVAIPLLMVLLPLLAIMSWKQIRSRPRPWLAAAVVFAVLTAPLAFFVVKNHVLKRDYPIERYLPFSAPLLTETRYDQIQAEMPTRRQKIAHNLHVIRTGFISNAPVFEAPDDAPLPKVVRLFAAIGLLVAGAAAIRTRKLSDPFLAWVIACVPLVLFVPLNTSRSIEMFEPLLALAALGAATLVRLRPEGSFRGIVLAAILLLLAFPAVSFAKNYFGPKYRERVRTYTFPDMPLALSVMLQHKQAGDQAYVTTEAPLNYMQVVFYLWLPPREFQRTTATVQNPDFGDFHFARDRLEAGRSLVYVLGPTEAPPCANSNTFQQLGNLAVGRCPTGPDRITTADLH